MSENTQVKISQQTQDTQADKREILPQESTKKSLIDLKRIQVDSNSQKEVAQNPNSVPGTPSIQVLEEQQNDKGQTSFGEVISQQQSDEQLLQKMNQPRNSIKINLTSTSQFSPRKGEYGSSLSPKRKIQGGSNTPCMTPLPDLKVQRSKFDISQTQFFITNINAFRGLESFPKINELHNQISTIIDDLEGKVDTVVERHEADFLFAYRNHMTKIKQEMVDMKKQAEEQEKRLNDNDRVAGLERQIVWLRDECLNLYKILGKKKDDLVTKERTIRDLQRDNQHLQNQIKEIMKKNKLLQMKVPIGGTNPTQQNMSNNTQQSMIGVPEQLMNIKNAQLSPKADQQQSNSQQQNEIISNQLNQSQTLENNNQLQQSVQQEDEMYITQNYQIYQQSQPLNQSTQPSPTSKRASLQPQNQIQITHGGQQIIHFEQIITKQQIAALEETNPEFASQIISFVKRNIEGEISVAQLILEISQFCKIITDRKQKQYKQTKDKLDKTLKEKLKMGMARSDLESFFLECVETARKQIIKRKYAVGGGQNQVKGGVGSISQNNQNSIFQSPPANKNMSEFIESIKDYKVFRNEDKVKILELLLSHEKLLMFLYQKIFPTHFNLHLQNALESQEEVPLYLRPQKNQNKYININDNSLLGSQSKSNENYLDLLTEEDPSVKDYSDNVIYQTNHSKSHENSNKLPSISESYSHQPISNLYSVNLKNKRNSVDQRSAYESTNNNSLHEYSQGTARYSVQASKLGSLGNKYSQQRNSSLRNSQRSGSNYEGQLDQRNKSMSKYNENNNSQEDSKQFAYNVKSDIFQQLNGSDIKKQVAKINYSAQKTKQNNQQILSNTSPLANPNSQDNHIVPDKLNIVNGKLVFKNI